MGGGGAGCRWRLVDLPRLGLLRCEGRTTFDEEVWAALCLFWGVSPDAEEAEMGKQSNSSQFGNARVI